MDNELDKELKQIVAIAQQYPTQSKKRQKALGRLVETIVLSQKLWQPQESWFYQDIYDDAKQNLWLYLCEEIDKYDPNRGSIISWLNTLMYKRFYTEAKIKALGESIESNYASTELDYLASDTKKPYLSEILKKCIEVDSGNYLKTKYPKERPDANFQYLAKLRLAGVKWREISDQMGIKPSTLNYFFQRTLERVKLKLKECMQNCE